MIHMVLDYLTNQGTFSDYHEVGLTATGVTLIGERFCAGTSCGIYEDVIGHSASFNDVWNAPHADNSSRLSKN